MSLFWFKLIPGWTATRTTIESPGQITLSIYIVYVTFAMVVPELNKVCEIVFPDPEDAPEIILGNDAVQVKVAFCRLLDISISVVSLLHK